jgi:ferredoxin--NADP+ reductase
MTPKELSELGHLEATLPLIDLHDFPPLEADATLEPGQRKSVTILREFNDIRANRPKSMIFDFFAKPTAIEGQGKAQHIIVERTELDEKGGARGTGETYEVPASLIVTSIGYSTPPVDGVAYDERGGKFLNQGGRIGDRLYAVGWARRGPTGTIGTNRPDGYEVADKIAAELPAAGGGDRAGSEGLKRLLESRGVIPTDYDDWRKIEGTEVARARPGSPREKFVRVEHWLNTLGR